MFVGNIRWTVLILVLFAVGCSSKEPIDNVVTEPIIYEEPAIEEPAPIEDASSISADNIIEETSEISDIDNLVNSTENILNETEPINITLAAPAKEEFKFNPSSLVNSQNGVSFSLDDMKYEIKQGNWGKVTDLFSTVYNKDHDPFKPEVIVRVYDDADSIEEKSRLKAEFDYGIEELKQGEHADVHAIVNAVYTQLNVSKHIEMILVDGNLQNHRSIALVEMDFDPSK